MLRFAYPLAFVLLLIPILRVWAAYRYRLVAPALDYSDTRLFAGLPVSLRVRYRHVPDIVRWLVWVLLVTALAQPQAGQAQSVIRGQGIDIVLALDISNSMAALDFAPQNRLEAARSVISNFIAGRSFDRIGLVIFAADAFQIVPPTLDYAALRRSLDTVVLAVDLGLEDRTAIGSGLASAANLLRDSDAVSKIIILLTDGANNAGEVGPLTAAQAAAALGMRVYTIGMGKSSLEPVTSDASGDIALVEVGLDESTLQSIAQITGGQYFRAEDLPNLQRIYDQIDLLERSDVERQELVRWQEQGRELLILALVGLLAERLLRQTVFQELP